MIYVKFYIDCNMKVNILEAHDRFDYFIKQDFSISKFCQDIINQRPFGEHPFYIFAHARTLGMDEKMDLFTTGKYASFDKVPEKKMIWQPRLTKPPAQTNSMLFKAYPGSDNIKIIWMIPPRELWAQYKQGNVTQNEIIFTSIYDFEHNIGSLEAKEPDDLSDAAINMIYKEISRSAKRPAFEMV